MPWYHYSRKQIKELNDIKQYGYDKTKYYDGGKPRGLWLSYNQEWFELTGETPKFYYKVILKKNINILTIDKVESLEKFMEVYYNYKKDYLDWKKVSEDYDGIKITNFFKIKEKIFSHLPWRYPEYESPLWWFYALDINCMCIWRPSKAISKLIEVKK